MVLTLYNTVTKLKEVFKPIDNKKVKMYVCGPTVYDLIHIGNARSQIVYDILYRILINVYGKNCVFYSQNITDIEDKIIDRAIQKNISTSELTEKSIKCFMEDVNYLGCIEPNFRPKATEHITNIISTIEKLIESEHAYASNNSVYFNTKSVENYDTLFCNTKICNFDILEPTTDKKNKEDFALWKKGKTIERKEDLFDSPWGKGRPGWHIECSIMIKQTLGDTIDIHGGGIDLKFPHHKNEVAQSISAFNTNVLANFWVHNEMLLVENKKMSKSLNNFITVRDLITKNIPASVFRFFTLNTHYRKKINFSNKAIEDAKKKLSYIMSCAKIANIDIQNYLSQNIEYVLPSEFKNAILDDLNTHGALEYLISTAKKVHKQINIQENTHNILKCMNFLGLIDSNPLSKNQVSSIDDAKIQSLIEERENAKLNKQWEKADEIRYYLKSVGITLIDQKHGTTKWFR